MFKLFDEIKNVLESIRDNTQTKKYFSLNDELLRTKVDEDARKHDPELISSLFNNQKCKDSFFEEISANNGKISVFLKDKFCQIINNHSFLPDSYTAFENKIGLTVNGNYLSRNNDVVLSFPHKDCVLEGGQTKEDQKRDEVFFNEVLAQDEISTMLEPKCFINAKRYDKDHLNGKDIREFNDNDNLVIKGNNLIALSSILPRYEQKVKCIFIDPPYYFINNKPSDSFSYNSNFKLSSWLVFMKNRLELAHRLLKNDGVLYITISDEGAHYLKVMSDDIFDMDNFIADVTWESRKSISSDGLISENNNHILVYAKNKKLIDKNSFRVSLDIESFAYDDNDGKGRYKPEPFDAPGIRKNLEYVITNPNTGENFVPPMGRHWKTEESKYKRLLSENKIRFGANGTARPQYKAYYAEVKDAGKGKAVSSIWHNVKQSIIWQETDTNTNATKAQVQLFGEVVFTNPKPEDLIKRAIELSTSERDIVLDFFMGSGTTQAVAMKMGRRFIGLEQMEYIHSVTIPRLQKVIEGEQTGISSDVNWQGGGSFVYCELAKLNMKYVDEIQAATTEDEIKSIYSRIIETGFVTNKVDPKEIDKNTNEFYVLALDEQKRFLMELLDKNLLYVNYCDIDDEDCQINDTDKAFSKSFYED